MDPYSSPFITIIVVSIFVSFLHSQLSEGIIVALIM